jgi:hypothetical protein
VKIQPSLLGLAYVIKTRFSGDKVFLPHKLTSPLAQLSRQDSAALLETKLNVKLFVLQAATDPVLAEVYKKLIKPHKKTMVTDDIEGLRNMCLLHNYAYAISKHSPLSALSQYKECSIIAVPQAYYSYTASIIVRKDFPYKRLFHYQ